MILLNLFDPVDVILYHPQRHIGTDAGGEDSDDGLNDPWPEHFFFHISSGSFEKTTAWNGSGDAIRPLPLPGYAGFSTQDTIGHMPTGSAQ